MLLQSPPRNNGNQGQHAIMSNQAVFDVTFQSLLADDIFTDYLNFFFFLAIMKR